MHERATAAVEVELLEPVIASAEVATAAEPASLSYLPGAMLWGLLVSRSYKSGRNSADIFDKFYTDQVTIGDALPYSETGLGLPAPMSLHRSKNGDDWEDWAIDRRKAGFNQIKPGHWGPGLKEVPVAMQRTQRTAIDPVTGMAAHGMFFGLSAIAAGQRFVAPVTAPDIDTLNDVLAELHGDHRLGRSRNAEFGQVRLTRSDAWSLPEPGDGKVQFLWCLSDLAAHDEHYQPAERPNKHFFGGDIDWTRSFVRHRRYSPFNGEWQRRLPERLVISRGSVIALHGNSLTAGLHHFGFHNELGLGLVLASPVAPINLLLDWPARVVAPHFSSENVRTPLSRWLAERRAEREGRDREAQASSDAWNVWGVRYEAAQRLAGEKAGPTPSQWAAIAQLNGTELLETLNRLAGPDNRREAAVWQARFALGKSGTFVQAALAELAENGASALCRQAKSIRRELISRRWFDG